MTDQEMIWPEYIAPISYELCDALLALFCAAFAYTATRTTRTSGSCTYVIRQAPQTIGMIYLRTAFKHKETGEDQVRCTLVPNRKGDPRTHAPPDELLNFLVSFWAYCEAIRLTEPNVPRVDLLPLGDGKTIPQRIAEAYPMRAPEPKGPKQPEEGDSIAVWLDWRAWKRRRRQHITLEEIASQSGHSLSTLKKASAERKPRGTK